MKPELKPRKQQACHHLHPLRLSRLALAAGASDDIELIRFEPLWTVHDLMRVQTVGVLDQIAKRRVHGDQPSSLNRKTAGDYFWTRLLYCCHIKGWSRLC